MGEGIGEERGVEDTLALLDVVGVVGVELPANGARPARPACPTRPALDALDALDGVVPSVPLLDGVDVVVTGVPRVPAACPDLGILATSFNVSSVGRQRRINPSLSSSLNAPLKVSNPKTPSSFLFLASSFLARARHASSRAFAAASSRPRRKVSPNRSFSAAARSRSFLTRTCTQCREGVERVYLGYRMYVGG